MCVNCVTTWNTLHKQRKAQVEALQSKVGMAPEMLSVVIADWVENKVIATDKYGSMSEQEFATLIGLLEGCAK